MSRIIAFDVNETLPDVDALKPHFACAFGDELVLWQWFSTVLLYSEVASLAGRMRTSARSAVPYST
jgi:2-haloacid dehalogenase